MLCALSVDDPAIAVRVSWSAHKRAACSRVDRRRGQRSSRWALLHAHGHLEDGLIRTPSMLSADNKERNAYRQYDLWLLAAFHLRIPGARATVTTAGSFTPGGFVAVLPPSVIAGVRQYAVSVVRRQLGETGVSSELPPVTSCISPVPSMHSMCLAIAVSSFPPVGFADVLFAPVIAKGCQDAVDAYRPERRAMQCLPSPPCPPSATPRVSSTLLSVSPADAVVVVGFFTPLIYLTGPPPDPV